MFQDQEGRATNPGCTRDVAGGVESRAIERDSTSLEALKLDIGWRMLQFRLRRMHRNHSGSNSVACKKRSPDRLQAGLQDFSQRLKAIFWDIRGHFSPSENRERTIPPVRIALDANNSWAFQHCWLHVTVGPKAVHWLETTWQTIRYRTIAPRQPTPT